VTPLAGLLLAAGLIAATGAAAEAVGVAPFEAVAPAGQSVPDVAANLAQRLGTRGVGRVVGPHELGAPARFELPAGDAVALAERDGLDVLVVGRTTRLGSRLSLQARVLDGASGKPVAAPVVEEVERPEELGRSIDRLTGSVLERLAARPAPVSAAAAPVEKPEPKPKNAMSFDRSKPISIQSDQLESQPDPSGRRHLVFVGHVHVVQDELTLDSDQLEAFYPPGASEPEQLLARGHVTMKQGERRAHCAEATFFRSEERVVCTGQLAELEQACDRVRGPKIVFHLGSDRLEVEGGADVSLRPDLPGCGTQAAAGGSGR